ncbi:hypothetical protein SAMN05192530_10263 [Aureimonas jatrophae]|uniref:Uncharacterized protein n=1 Tax=Aureimonas jatrophae TaxID=1166073 RepID=A0A1H0EJ58_9HYPH|nr:hypothetical protein SAMN05192530_10263 [Aureimonas jatrophae]
MWTTAAKTNGPIWSATMEARVTETMGKGTSCSLPEVCFHLNLTESGLTGFHPVEPIGIEGADAHEGSERFRPF